MPTFFATDGEFRAWFEGHHADETELIVGFWRKATGKPSMTWEESRDQAICFGWIDGVRRSIDDEAYSIRFTPRKASSTWSRVNVERFRALDAAGLVTDAGRVAFERRREDRTGTYSHENREAAVLPPEFEARLRANAAAAEFFDSQPASYRKTAIHLVISAKREETRERRLEQLIADSAAGLRIKQLRW